MTEKSMEAHLAIVSNTETGLFHSALYVNHPTPSGSDRYLLSKTTTEGYVTQRSAAMAINASYPDLDQLDLEMLPAEVDQDIDQLIAALPKLATINLITPRDKLDGNPYVEVRRSDLSKKPLPIPIHPGMVNKLEAQKIIEFDSTSGDDPELSARYDNYVVVCNNFAGIQKMTTVLEYLYLTASIMNEFNWQSETLFIQ